MLLFDKKENTELEPVVGWQKSLKKTLIEKCHRFLKTHPRKQRSIHKPKLWYNFENNQFKEEHNYSLESKGQGAYSQFIPVKSNHCHSNELSEYFPYLKQNCDRAEYQMSIFDISQSIESAGDYDKWMVICKEYLSDLTIEEMFDYYLLMIAKGTSFLNKIRVERDPKCKEFPFFSKILEIKRFFINQDSKINPHISVSLDQGDTINLENLSKTMKHLFCPICMIYDCQAHLLSTSAIQNNFQYIQAFDTRHRFQDRKRSALKLFKQIFVIFDEEQIKETQFCSWNCYKRLNLQKWEKVKSKREKRFFSPIFEGLIKMGTEMFHYNPCLIQTLFSNNQDMKAKKMDFQVNCEIVFSYFLQEYNLLQKMNFKFYKSEAQQLRNEEKGLTFVTPQITPKKALKSKHCKIKEQNNDESFNSVCYHYFLDKEPHDINCLSCQCQIRGYCIPSCACSDFCEIKIKGCRCKGESNCWENKCACFKNNMMCIPGLCQHCMKCNETDGKANWCQNNEMALHQAKKTRIGKSNIPNAGLGLFTKQFIRKGEFVIKYLGQVINSISLEKLRENLVQNNLFYTFKLNKFESVDSRIFGNKARFINHSKKHENIVPRAVNINEQYVIVFHAIKDIQQDDELLFNYNGQGDLSEFKQKFPFIES